MKLKLREQRSAETDLLECCDKNWKESEMGNRIFNQIQLRDNAYSVFRTLAKTIYNLTDDKFLTYGKIE